MPRSRPLTKNSRFLLSIDSSSNTTEAPGETKKLEVHQLSNLIRKLEEKSKKMATSTKAEESRLKDLHPYTCPLTLKNLDSCVVLEELAYKDSRGCAAREKLKYRLSKCGELCLGLFCTVLPESGFEAETLATSLPVETGRENKAVSVLLGHVIATKTHDVRVSEESISVPKDWESQNPEPSTFGHQEDGRTIVLHSVAVLPGYRSRGIGNTLIMALIHQVKGTGIADRLVMTVQEDLIDWFEERGFANVGPAMVTFGSGRWRNMIQELVRLEDKSESA